MDKMKDAAEMGKRLRAIRAYRGKSGEQVGAALGVTRQQVSLIERGVSKLTAVQAVQVAEYLGVSVGMLLGTEPLELEEPEEAATPCVCHEVPGNVLEFVRQATPEGLERLSALVGAIRPRAAA